MLVSATLSLSYWFTASPPTEIYTLSLHDALPISMRRKLPDDVPTRWSPSVSCAPAGVTRPAAASTRNASDSPRTALEIIVEARSEEHTSELQSLTNLVCRLLLEKKKKIKSRAQAM